MKIKEYTQIKESTLTALSNGVNAYIGIGYQPYGDPFTFSDIQKQWFVQAMVKYEKPESSMDDKYLHNRPDGWYFEDETGSIEGNGPYPTKDTCHIGLNRYATELSK